MSYPSKKGLVIFIGILGIVSLVIGGVLVYLTADFIPWPECPLTTVDWRGEDVVFLYKYTYESTKVYFDRPMYTTTKWECVYHLPGESGTNSLGSRNAHGSAMYLGDHPIVLSPRVGAQINHYITFGKDNLTIVHQTGEFGQLVSAIVETEVAVEFDLSPLFGEYEPAAIVTTVEGVKLLLLPNGELAQFLVLKDSDRQA